MPRRHPIHFVLSLLAIPFATLTAAEDWQEQSLDFIQRYYPDWSEIEREDAQHHVAFSVELEALEINRDPLAWRLGEQLVRDRADLYEGTARTQFLMERHLDALDRNLLNRWTLPLLGSQSARDRAREAEWEERLTRLRQDTDRVIEFVAQSDPREARAMRAQLRSSSEPLRPQWDR